MMKKDLIKENQMSRQVIHTENAPAAIGTYSQ
ncbi:RidA family protein, partial [Salmonella enterica]|nr:RidA family protein [Salmonella enterica]